MLKSTSLKSYEPIENGYLLHTDGPKIKIIFLTKDIVRMRASFDNKFAEESYSLVMTAWEDRFDNLLGDERARVTALIPELIDTDKCVSLKSESLTLQIKKSNFAIKIFDKDGDILHQDLEARAFVQDNKKRNFHYSMLDYEFDRFYGFGERTGNLNKMKSIISNSPKDSIGHDAEKTDHMYKYIPFYIKIKNNIKKACGFFYHNTYESVFNIGLEISGYWDRFQYFRTDGGDLDIFFINGPSVGEVIHRYTDLTGKTAMPTAKSLGYLGSTMYYVELPKDCDKEIYSFVDKNRKLGIPIDGFQLSSGYTVKNDRRYVFYWNAERFSNPDEFFNKMNESGIPVSPNVKPGILLSHPYHAEFCADNAFIKNADGNGNYVDKWWGGLGNFVDFTNPSARNIWKKLMKKYLVDKGANSIWNDNCEYDCVNDKEALCHFEGQPDTIARLQPVQPNLMSRVSWELLREVYPDQRPYIISRSGYAGIQRYAQTWAGDNFTEWKTIKYNLNTIMGMGLSGVANNGCDVAGFYGPHPDKELFIRWVQAGIFFPRFSIHSSNTDNTVTEPWMYGEETTELVKKAIKLRYRLFPYIYSLFYEAHISGEPILRPMFYDFLEDESVYYHEDKFQFMFGKNILVANVLEPSQKQKRIYLPKGCNWYFLDDMSLYEGGQEIILDVNIESIPMFIRDGAIILSAKDLSSFGEKFSTLEVLITKDSNSNFMLYEDDGISFIQNKRNNLLTEIAVTQESKVVKVSFKKMGEYPESIKMIEVRIVDKEKGAYWVKINDELIPQILDEETFNICEKAWRYSGEHESIFLKYPNKHGNYDIYISYDKFDLIGMADDE